MTKHHSALHEVALSLAARGIPVFPLHSPHQGQCTCRRPGCASVGKHPRTKNGHKNASTDPEQIAMWWRSWPHASVGARTGGGLLVLDIDPRHRGDGSLTALVASHGPLPSTPTVNTGGGGKHFYFRVEGVVPCKTGLRPGVDVRCDGGYVVAPPSAHASGASYVWADGMGLDDLPVASAPAWLLDAIAETAPRPGKAIVPEAAAQRTAVVVEAGGRNNHLMSIAGRLRRDGANEAAIGSELERENELHCRPPLDAIEVRGIAASACRYLAGASATSVTEALRTTGIAKLTSESTIPEREAAARQLKLTAASVDSLGRTLLRDELVRRYGFSTGAADAILRKTPAGEAKQQGSTLLFKEPSRWPDRVDVTALLDEISHTISAYVVLPRHCASTIALWIVHTHAFDAAQITPRLAIISPEKRCGKSTVLKLLGALVRRPLETTNLSAAALFRSIEAHSPTLLVDEADTFLREREELRGVLNAGHDRQSAKVVRCVGDESEPRVFRVWSPVAFASIGRQHDTLMDRSVVFSMKRRSRTSEPVQKFRRRERDGLVDLHRKLIRCAADNVEAFGGVEVEAPAGLNDRAADNWEPLLAIAEIAGGDWPERARTAALALSTSERAGEPDTQGELLLGDIREIFEQTGVTDVTPKELLAELVEMDERPWREANRGRPMSARQLGTRLGRFEIHSRSVRHGKKSPRSYVRSDFDDAFSRYLAPLGATTGTSSEAFVNLDDSRLSQRTLVADADHSNSTFDFAGVTDVTDTEATYVASEREAIQEFNS